MPANLPPQYFEVEKKLRLTDDPEEKIAVIEEMLAVMPKHKGTDHLRAELRAKIAKLTEQAAKRPEVHRTSMVIHREGAAQVAVVGPTSVGKSQLVASLTKASPMVADYPYVTHEATPGMMRFENVQIQLIDTPALAPQTLQFWLPPLLRRADALLIMINLSSDPIAQVEDIIARLRDMRIELGKDKTRALVVGNKIDLPAAQKNYAALKARYEGQLPVIAISAKEGTGLEEFKKKVYEILDIIRVYTKKPGQKADFNEPVVLPRGSTLEDAAAAIHKSFVDRLKYARVWGSGKHDGLMVRRGHVLQEGDVIELHL